MPANKQVPIEVPSFYINTCPGRKSMFSAPGDVPNYTAWFIAQFSASCGGSNEYSTGIAQQVQAMLNNHRGRGADIYAFGPHAHAAVCALRHITGGQLNVEALL